MATQQSIPHDDDVIAEIDVVLHHALDGRLCVAISALFAIMQRNYLHETCAHAVDFVALRQ